MAKLTAKARKKIPASKFALKVNGVEKYPVEDKPHAADAKAYATTELAKGKLTPAQAAKVRHRADVVLGENDSTYHGNK